MEDLKIRKATDKDWDFIRNLRNSEYKYFCDHHYISELEHVDFMERYGHQYYIGFTPVQIPECSPGHFVDTDIGFVGVKGNDIRFAVWPTFHNQGYGSKLLQYISKLYPNAIGKVKVDNIASKKAFIKAGYKTVNLDEYFIYFQHVSKEEL